MKQNVGRNLMDSERGMNAAMSGEAEEAFREALARLADEWSVPCDGAQLDALVAYATLLLTWTARINLTGANSLADLSAEHFPDSFAIASRLPAAEPLSVIDVGSGGGLPALPLAILRPSLSIRLFEPIAKKAAFLRTAIRELGATARLTVVGKRAEPLEAGTFDVAVSRATLAPPAWMALAATLVRPGGRVFVLASADSNPDSVPAPLSLNERFPYLDGKRFLLDLQRTA
jgi:16S rRNA (guanine527-N7)-methyltransferase